MLLLYVQVMISEELYLSGEKLQDKTIAINKKLSGIIRLEHWLIMSKEEAVANLKGDSQTNA